MLKSLTYASLGICLSVGALSTGLQAQNPQPEEESEGLKCYPMIICDSTGCVLDIECHEDGGGPIVQA